MFEKMSQLLLVKLNCNISAAHSGAPLSLLHSKRPKLYAILASLSAIGLP